MIEHENAWRVEETQRDFRKICLYAVPLRVMIGYQRSEEEALRTGQELVQFYHQWGLRQPRDSETVLAATLLQN